MAHPRAIRSVLYDSIRFEADRELTSILFTVALLTLLILLMGLLLPPINA